MYMHPTKHFATSGEPTETGLPRGLGLRGKSLLALLFSCLVALVPAALLGWQAVVGIREDFGLAYARNFNELHREKIVAPVLRELALAQRMADSDIIRRWMAGESSASLRQLVFSEIDGYRRAFADHSVFLAAVGNARYYFCDGKRPCDQPVKTMSAANKDDAWYFASMRNTDRFNINVDTDAAIGQTKVWINVVVRKGDQKLGLAGSGLNLSDFVRDFVVSNAAGVTPMIVDRKGRIQAHPDKSLIVLNTGSGAETAQATVFDLLADDNSRRTLQAALQDAERTPANAQTGWIRLAGKRQLVAVSYIPELQWHVLTAVDLGAAHFVDTDWIIPAGIAIGLLLLMLLTGLGYAVERLVLLPLRRLQQSAQAVADGHYDVALPAGTADEIGELSRTFGVMADQIRHHTQELEQKVQERTAALETSHREIAAAHQKLGASIDYASLIQRAILPDRQMLQSLGPHHFVFWRPRDVVGGDFYVFRDDDENYLLGIVDCAGHGVPGALMTMLARSAIDRALEEVGPRSPAAILARTDAAMRTMIEDSQRSHGVATNMDAGLVYVDRAARRILFAGAKISLYWSDGQSVEEVKGGRRSLGDRKSGTYSDQELALDGVRTYSLTTDGFLDQAGGDHGFGFGKGRFCDMLRHCAALPLAEQSKAIADTFNTYRGNRPQRDDITVLSFRFD